MMWSYKENLFILRINKDKYLEYSIRSFLLPEGSWAHALTYKTAHYTRGDARGSQMLKRLLATNDGVWENQRQMEYL